MAEFMVVLKWLEGIQDVKAAVAADENSYALANPLSPVMEISVDAEEGSMLGNTSRGQTQLNKPES